MRAEGFFRQPPGGTGSFRRASTGHREQRRRIVGLFPQPADQVSPMRQRA